MLRALRAAGRGVHAALRTVRGVARSGPCPRGLELRRDQGVRRPRLYGAAVRAGARGVQGTVRRRASGDRYVLPATMIRFFGSSTRSSSFQHSTWCWSVPSGAALLLGREHDRRPDVDFRVLRDDRDLVAASRERSGVVDEGRGLAVDACTTPDRVVGSEVGQGEVHRTRPDERGHLFQRRASASASRCSPNTRSQPEQTTSSATIRNTRRSYHRDVRRIQDRWGDGPRGRSSTRQAREDGQGAGRQDLRARQASRSTARCWWPWPVTDVPAPMLVPADRRSPHGRCEVCRTTSTTSRPTGDTLR